MFMRRLRYWKESAIRSEALREEMELHIAERAAQLQEDGMNRNARGLKRAGNLGMSA